MRPTAWSRARWSGLWCGASRRLQRAPKGDGERFADRVTIREGSSEDAEAAVTVYLAANDARRRGKQTASHRLDRVRRNMARPDTLLLVAQDSGGIVGMAFALPSRADGGAGEPIPGLCFISMVFVAPDRWGGGIGGQLVDAILAMARVRGYDRAELWTHADNERAQGLYERHGFRRSGRELVEDGGDRIIHVERIIDG